MAHSYLQQLLRLGSLTSLLALGACQTSVCDTWPDGSVHWTSDGLRFEIDGQAEPVLLRFLEE